jgi:predicted RND superfamily exporter protein
MKKMLGIGFWELIARFILRNRLAIIISIILITIFLALQWKNIRFTHSEANLIPADDKVNVDYNAFLKTFGEEGNLIIIGTNGNELISPKLFSAYSTLIKDIQNDKEISLVISVDNLQKLVKNDTLQTFELKPFVNQNKVNDSQYLVNLKNELFTKMPFYEGLLFNKKSNAIRTAIYLDKKIVNTPTRKEYVLHNLIPKIEAFEKKHNVDLRVSGMPYIRTLNAKTIVDEIGLFIGAALLITSLIFFFFFRSFRATLISLVIVVIGVMWSFGILALLNYEITVLTALVPTLVIVIGIPNCIFFINKYHQEFQKHANKAKALQRVITKTGTATLMTNITTAVGFATFIITNNVLLREFGVVTTINILAIYLLSLVIIPIFFSYIPTPVPRHLGAFRT